ncbi:MAG: acyltransferase family protein [Dysgonomonas sp.]|uniref:acyltransferase family protein n=1 Tax=Dysgonomonas sp. TaxID=1891233 RepID=UPI003A83AD92
MTQKPSGRLLSLDVLRGITIAGMIMVNNSGSGEYTYAPLKHVAWDGLTPTDLVFPFFMFIMGISTYISLRKFNFEFNTPTLLKILKRTIVIFLIGLGLSWLGLSFRTYHMLEPDNLGFWERFFRAITDFGHLRTLGVMQRLALTYGAASIVAITVKHKYIPYIIGTTLIVYFLLLLFGNGFEKSEDSIVSIVDRAILGVNHMYKDSGLAIDPEGLLSTIPAIAHVLIGFCCGALIMNTKDNDKRISQLFIVGTILTFAGFLLSYGCPINKKIWTPTFVLATCGLASLLLALLIWIIDIKGHRKWSVFFESFGVNPLFIYVMAGVLGTLAYQAVFPYNGEYISAKGYIYSVLLQPYLGDYFGALIYALIFVGICWIVGNILYKKNIYIKI